MPAVTTKESEALAASGGQQTATCDRCRVLKVKCLPPENEEGSSTGSRKAPCRRCHRAGHDCTFDYSFKRSGRPLGKANKSKSTRSPSERRSASRPISPPSSSGPSRERLLSGSVGDSHSPAIPLSSITHSDSYHPPPPPRSSARNDSTDYSDIGHFTPADNNIHQSDDVNAQSHFWGPPKDSIFGSARMTFEAADYHYPLGEWTHGVYSRRPSFDYTTPPSHMAQRTGPSPLTGPSPAFSAGGQSHVSFDNNMPARQRPGTGEVSNVSQVDIGSRSFGQQPQIVPQELFNALPDAPPAPQVESIGSWSEFCFFFSLWMRHQHSLVPLVHKPTFAMDVLHRRDQRDEPFRALLFSIVTYTICQCPINVMSSDFSRERLLALLQQCQKASRRIQLEYQSRPSLILAASTAMDILSSQATNRPDLTSVLFSDAQRIIYTLHLNQVEAPQATSLIDIEVGRRIFWQVYSTDKTNVMNGGNMLFNNHEGVPPLPLDVEDERITSTGIMPSSSSTAGGFTNYIAGFIAVVQIFRILGECQLRHRTLLNDPTASQDPLALLQWVQHAVSRLQSITESLPVDLRAKRTTIGPDGKSKAINVTLNTTPDSAATAGIQQANIFITAMCAEFALLDFRTALNPEEDLRSQRETIAKKAYETLSSIPIEYLASNGEAMRGKVLRTILALFNASTSPEELGDSVWDWWSMYSQVQFIQVIPTGQ